MLGLALSPLSVAIRRLLGSKTTWAMAGALALNVALVNDWEKSNPFDDLTATHRGYRKAASAFDDSPAGLATLKANGQPAEDFAVILLDNGVVADEGDYLCSFSGTGTPEAYAFDGSISGLQTVGGVTTFTLHRNTFAGSDPRIILRVTGVGANFGDTKPLQVLRVGVARTDTKVFGSYWMAHLSVCSWIRYMNWSEVNGSTDTTVAGSLAFATNKTNKYAARLDVQVSMSNRLRKHGWFNIPALADATFRQTFISYVQQNLAGGLKAKIEYANEPWNPLFDAFHQGVAAVKTLTGARCGTPEIASISRSGGTVTALLVQPHSLSAGQSIGIVGVPELSAGVFVLTSGSTGSTLKWSDPGADVASGTIDTDEDTTIFLAPAHMLVAPTANLPLGTLWDGKDRHDAVKTREIRDQILATPGAAARMRAVCGVQLYGVDRLPGLLQWVNDTYGDCDWCDWSPAYYSFPADPASLTTEQAVRDQLEEGRLLSRKKLLQFVAICQTYGAKHWALYEMGPHTDIKDANTEAAIGACHNSDWMRSFAAQMLRDVRDIAQCVAAWFNGGAVDTFGTITNNTWCLGTPHISQYATFPKWKAMDETSKTGFAPDEIEGVTAGAMPFGDAFPQYAVVAGNTIITPTDKVPGNQLTRPIVAGVTGPRTITLNACGNFGGDKVDILLDGNVIASNVSLPNQNPYAEAALQAWTGVVNLNKGSHTLTVRLSGTRAAQIGIGFITTRIVNSGTRFELSGTQLKFGGVAKLPRGINQGTWGKNNSVDAPAIAGLGSDHVRLLIRSNLGGTLNSYEDGTDAYDAAQAENGHFKATHRAQFTQEIDWAGASMLWSIVAFDTDQGQGVGRISLPATVWDFFDGSPEAAIAKERFFKGWEWIAKQCVGRPRILAYELLPEPLPYNSSTTDAALLRQFFRELIARIRAIDPLTPFLIGPRASYGPNNIEEAYLSERTDCIYTIDALTNRVSSEGTIAALIEGFKAWCVSKNVPGLIQQLGRNTSEDIGDINADGTADTTENIGLTAMNGAMSLCNALQMPFTWWQYHQNTNNLGVYGLYAKTVYPGPDTPDNWTPKVSEINSFAYHMGQSRASLVVEGEAAVTDFGGHLFRIKTDLSNVFTDTAGTTPCTTAGQSVARINAVVGTMYFSQATAINRPTLVKLSNGEWALNFSGTQWFDASNVTYYGTTDDQIITVAARATAGNANRVLLHCGLASGIVRYPYIGVLGSDDLQASWRGDDNVGQNISTTTLCDDRSFVHTARKVGAAKTSRLNGVQEGATNNTALGTITGPFTRMRWGASSTGTNGFTGTCTLLMLGKTATDEQMRHVGRLGAWLQAAPYRGAIPAPPPGSLMVESLSLTRDVDRLVLV